MKTVSDSCMSKTEKEKAPARRHNAGRPKGIQAVKVSQALVRLVVIDHVGTHPTFK